MPTPTTCVLRLGAETGSPPAAPVTRAGGCEVRAPGVPGEVDDPTLRWWKRLPDITAPTLLVGGDPTSHVPQDLLVDVVQAVPDCTLLTIPVGHDVHEVDPDAFTESVLRWLDTELADGVA